VIMEENTLTQGQTYSVNVYAVGGAVPLKATLAWTDRPGASNNGTVDSPAAKLVNNLDIRITKNDQTFFPWKLTPSLTNPVAVKEDNNADNIEKVEIEGAVQEYTVTVSHKGTLVGGSQKYSLIITGIDQNMASTESNEMSFFSVWPNPANDVINISLSSGISGSSTATMYDAQGRVVLQNKLASTDNVLNIQGLASGVYFVNVTSGILSEVKKVIIK